MGTSKTQPNDWMLKDGTGKSSIIGDARGWVRVQPDGQEVVIQCMSGVTYIPKKEKNITEKRQTSTKKKKVSTSKKKTTKKVKKDVDIDNDE